MKNYELHLQHHGVKGQKWGVRRYQNPDGSLKKGHENRYGEPPSYKKGTGRAKRNTARGKQFADKFDKQKTVKALKTTAAVASGALWLASAVTTGNLAAGTNAIAAVSSIISALPHENDSQND